MLTQLRALVAVTLVLSLAACAAPGPTGGPVPGAAAPPLLLGPGGLVADGTGLEVSFGRSRDGAVSAATRLVGQPPGGSGPVAECGAGAAEAVVYDDGLTLYFLPEGFAGWAARDGNREWRTTGGLRSGMSRAEAVALPGAHVARTSLGEEIDVAGITALIGPVDTVQTLFAGEICAAR